MGILIKQSKPQIARSIRSGLALPLPQAALIWNSWTCASCIDQISLPPITVRLSHGTYENVYTRAFQDSSSHHLATVIYTLTQLARVLITQFLLRVPLLLALRRQ
ncbi:hypothetical protein HZ326_23918 [Fusarium oxysporum f. sp. albedinis]|nr:hypothetical protein HZ326_23918 [Fusarium oxysporum f. sp. albedinis]